MSIDNKLRTDAHYMERALAGQFGDYVRRQAQKIKREVADKKIKDEAYHRATYRKEWTRSLMSGRPESTPEVPGIMNERDRHWKITKDDFEGWMTDYNWEITGATANIAALDSDIRYSHSAWYWTAELRRRGYQVEAVRGR